MISSRVSPSINIIPYDVLDIIFSNFLVHHAARIATVCKVWNTVIRSDAEQSKPGDERPDSRVILAQRRWKMKLSYLEILTLPVVDPNKNFSLWVGKNLVVCPKDPDGALFFLEMRTKGEAATSPITDHHVTSLPTTETCIGSVGKWLVTAPRSYAPSAVADLPIYRFTLWDPRGHSKVGSIPEGATLELVESVVTILIKDQVFKDMQSARRWLHNDSIKWCGEVPPIAEELGHRFWALTGKGILIFFKIDSEGNAKHHSSTRLAGCTRLSQVIRVHPYGPMLAVVMTGVAESVIYHYNLQFWGARKSPAMPVPDPIASLGNSPILRRPNDTVPSQAYSLTWQAPGIPHSIQDSYKTFTKGEGAFFCFGDKALTAFFPVGVGRIEWRWTVRVGKGEKISSTFTQFGTRWIGLDLSATTPTAAKRFCILHAKTGGIVRTISYGFNIWLLDEADMVAMHNTENELILIDIPTGKELYRRRCPYSITSMRSQRDPVTDNIEILFTTAVINVMSTSCTKVCKISLENV